MYMMARSSRNRWSSDEIVERIDDVFANGSQSSSSSSSSMKNDARDVEYVEMTFKLVGNVLDGPETTEFISSWHRTESMERKYVLSHQGIRDSFEDTRILPADAGKITLFQRGDVVKIFERVWGIFEIIFTSIFTS